MHSLSTNQDSEFMSLNLENLDGRTRKLMIRELEADVAADNVYISARLSEIGRGEYVDLLKQAMRSQGDLWLAAQLRSVGRMNPSIMRRSLMGSVEVTMPATAPVTLAEGEFNRFYARGLCVRALEDEKRELEVYRARPTLPAGQEMADLKVGARVNVDLLLEKLRAHQSLDEALGLPPGPNSGLSVRL